MYVNKKWKKEHQLFNMTSMDKKTKFGLSGLFDCMISNTLVLNIKLYEDSQTKINIYYVFKYLYGRNDIKIINYDE